MLALDSMLLELLIFIEVVIVNYLRFVTGANPVITKGPVDLAVSRGYEARMPCTASGRPKPDIKWFKNGKELVYGESRFRVLSDGALWFSKVRIGKRRSDQGVYWCTAKNDLGYARSQNATLTVLCKYHKFKTNSNRCMFQQ